MAAGGSNRFLSPEEVCALLGISKRTLYGKWNEWGMPAKRIGKHLRFRERDLEQWIAAQGP